MALPVPPLLPLHFCDACSLLNLIASRRFGDIAKALPVQLATAAQVVQEMHFVRRGGSGPDASDRELIDLAALQQSNLLTVLALEAHELATFVALATEIDDGEAAVGALVIHRGGSLITDDQKALRVLARRSPTIPVFSTPAIVKTWAEQSGLPDRDVARVLRDIEERASFRPSRRDPLASWWQTVREQP